MSEKTAKPTGSIVEVASSELGYGLRFIRKQSVRIPLIFLGVLLPLLVFAALVDELGEKGAFVFDDPVMLSLHRLATPSVDRFFVVMSEVGYRWGVIPLDVGILVALVWRRRFRDGLFFGLAVAGSALVNLAAKNHFVRFRPELWLSIQPETTFSFPSGHAMGSATLGVALILLLWRTRWRWLIFSLACLFVVLVGMSRIYLGVHYPSDILAGWMAGTAWVMAMHQLVAHRAPKPPTSATVAAAPDLIAQAKKPKS
jgi:undecaprenyl-diphosphatase